MTTLSRKVGVNIGYTLAGIVWCIATMLFFDRFWLGLLLISIFVVIFVRLFLSQGVKALAFTVGASLPALALLAFLLHPVVLDWKHRTTFDAAGWKSRAPEADSRWPVRLCMVDDLLSHHDFHGWQRSEVVSLLGEPDATRWDSGNQMVYHLGPERGLIRIDSEWLVISLGTDGAVREYKVRRD